MSINQDQNIKILTIEIQYKLKQNINYIKYLRENSHWYKILTRDPNKFEQFKEEVNINYKLRPVDKIEQMMDSLSLIRNLFETMK